MIPTSGWTLGVRSANAKAFNFIASAARIEARKVTPISSAAASPDVAAAHEAMRRFESASRSNGKATKYCSN